MALILCGGYSFETNKAYDWANNPFFFGKIKNWNFKGKKLEGDSSSWKGTLGFY
jgi:hypothetical protein